MDQERPQITTNHPDITNITFHYITTDNPEVQKFYDLLEVLSECCPSRNVRNLGHIMLNYAIAEAVCTEDKTVFTPQYQRIIETSLDRYLEERENNVLKDQADMEKREEEVECLELRYHMGRKLAEFNIRRAHKEAGTAFGKFPWVLILKEMDEEKSKPTLWKRNIDQKEHPSTPMTDSFKKAFQITKKGFGSIAYDQRGNNHPIIRQIPDAFRCHHDLLILAKHYAEEQMEGEPKISTLRKEGKWAELWNRLHFLDTNIRPFVLRASPVENHQLAVKRVLGDLQQYRYFWYQKDFNLKSWITIPTTKLTPQSTTSERSIVDLEILYHICNRDILRPENCIFTILEYSPSVMTGILPPRRHISAFERKISGTSETIVLPKVIPEVVSKPIPIVSVRDVRYDWLEMGGGGDLDIFDRRRSRGSLSP